MRLKDLGFPPPKSVSKLSLDWDMDTVPTFDYSIGELLSFIPDEIESEEDDFVATFQMTAGWEICIFCAAREKLPVCAISRNVSI